MNPDRFIIGEREVSFVENVLVTARPARTSSAHAADLLAECEKREKVGYASGIFNFGILMEALRDLDQGTPIEISLSVETVCGRARLLKIVHDDTTIYMAGRTKVRASDPYPAPDALTGILLENEYLRDRMAELEMRSGGMV